MKGSEGTEGKRKGRVGTGREGKECGEGRKEKGKDREG